MVDDFEKCLRYVELAEENLDTFSLEFSRIILVSGSEIDQMFKYLTHSLGLDRAANLPECVDRFRSHRPQFVDFDCAVDGWPHRIAPFSAWREGYSKTSWWSAYTGLKHNRIAERYSGNLKNVMECLAAHFGILQYLLFYEDDGKIISSHGRFWYRLQRPLLGAVTGPNELP